MRLSAYCEALLVACSFADHAYASPLELVDSGLALVQRRAVVVQHASERSKQSELERPIAWLHVPKTATSFGNTIAHYANASLPSFAHIPNCEKENCTHVTKKNLGHIEFQHRYPADTWFKDRIWDKAGRCGPAADWSGHAMINKNDFNQFKGRFATLLRQPEQRSASSYYCFGPGGAKPGWVANFNADVLGWARKLEGTVTKMLAGQECPAELGFQLPAGVPNVEVALTRLQTGFMFVGLSEYFELSVCLFHAMYGGECLPVEFDNMRPGKNTRKSMPYNITDMQGYRDPYDNIVYKAAETRFWNDVKDHNVSYQSCRQVYCPLAASNFNLEDPLLIAKSATSKTFQEILEEAMADTWPRPENAEDLPCDQCFRPTDWRFCVEKERTKLRCSSCVANPDSMHCPEGDCKGHVCQEMAATAPVRKETAAGEAVVGAAVGVTVNEVKVATLEAGPVRTIDEVEEALLTAIYNEHWKRP